MRYFSGGRDAGRGNFFLLMPCNGSGKKLEVLSFLLSTQDLGLTVFIMIKLKSPKRRLPEPPLTAASNARASGAGPSAATAWTQKT